MHLTTNSRIPPTQGAGVCVCACVCVWGVISRGKSPGVDFGANSYYKEKKKRRKKRSGQRCLQYSIHLRVSESRLKHPLKGLAHVDLAKKLKKKIVFMNFYCFMLWTS